MTELPSVPSVDNAKKQQYIVIAGVLVLVGAIGAASILLGQPSVVAPQQGKTFERDLKAPGETLSDQEIWIARSEERIKATEAALLEIQNTNRELQSANKDLSAQLQNGRAASALMGTVAPPILPTSSAANGAIQPVPPPPPPPTLLAPAGSQAAMPSGVPDQRQGVVQGGGIFKVSSSKTTADRLSASPGVTETASDEKAKKRRIGTWLPAGSFTKAVMLGGLDAPTGGQSQNNPHPVLLKLQDNSVLPNRFRSRTKECHLVGAGYGDIASERAYIRVETLSCVLKSGQVIDVPASGYIAGEDGKTGMRGRLVSKQGQLIAKALLAGVLSGVGGGLAQTRTTVSTSALGSTQTVDPGKIFEFGTYQGVGKAMDRIAQYYISTAEKIFPIIEVDAGRVVDVVFTKGVMLDGDINNQETHSEEGDE